MKFIKPVNFVGRPDGLAEFKGGKFANNKISKNDAKQERSNRRTDCSKRNILEYIEPSCNGIRSLAQVIEIEHHRDLHPALPFAASSPRTTRSMEDERLPFTRRRSPG